MIKPTDMDPESHSTASFYLGITGAALSLIGVLLSVYSLTSAEKSVWLGISGWLAAVILSWTLTRLCLNLIRINAALNHRLQDTTSQCTLFAEQNSNLKLTNNSLIDINAYIVSKAVRRPAARKESKGSANQPKKVKAAQAEEDQEDEV